ncbi:hypothetical protein [Streptococcus pluranimalium]|uniref:hypothetical protein n=1 Tax=Streptococcus pluranimalium TaxID=82348 RepID=UPI003F67CDE3
MVQKTKIAQLREFFRDNPNSTREDALLALKSDGFDANIIKGYIYRDKKRGFYREDDDGYITYIDQYDQQTEIDETNEWKRDIRRELVEQLMAANRLETSSEQIRMNSKVINQLLGEI